MFQLPHGLVPGLCWRPADQARMDSLTQIVLGASVAAAVVPPAHRRAALLAGALLGTLPDLDVLPLAFVDDPVARMTWHRSVSHSLFVLLPLAGLLWLGLRRFDRRVREAPRPWLAAIVLALGTHPLLDAHTVYGTQLWWPLPVAPTMWSTIFIIDPLYALPLLFGVLLAWRRGAAASARPALMIGLALSSTYLGWTWVAKAQVDRQFDAALADAGLAQAPRFSVPMPFTSFVWRAVALTPDGYVDAVTAPWRSGLVLRLHRADAEALHWSRSDGAAGERLDWFAHGFLRADTVADELVLSDLRMGLEPDYFFRFAVATREQGTWQPMPPRQLPRPETQWARLREIWKVE